MTLDPKLLFAPIILILIGLISIFSPKEILALRYALRQKIAGEKTTPSTQTLTITRISGAIFLVLGLVLLYLGISIQ